MRNSDLAIFYRLMTDLEARNGGRRRLSDCRGKMTWPDRGVYFFFESGEVRGCDPTVPRVVRVGTHAVTAKSRTTLWKRLRQHRGTSMPYGGNHRGSIFRGLAGHALMNRASATTVTSWRQGSSAPREVRLLERELEGKVSDYLGAMTLLFLPILDPSGPESQRGFIERNSIALLSNFLESTSDQPSPEWLGRWSGHERVRRSGLWNNNHADEQYDPDFLKIFEDLIVRSPFSSA